MATSTDRPPAIWDDPVGFSVGDVRFLPVAAAWAYAHLPSSAERFVLAKSRTMVEEYERLLVELEPERVVELGIYKGGSAVLVNELIHPERLVAIELDPDPVEALDQYIARHGLAGRLVARYGVDQADRGAIEAILGEVFDDDPLDLVIDDASHYLVESRASFNLLFPRLRPGGVYVIEDWAWPHRAWPYSVDIEAAPAGKGQGATEGAPLLVDMGLPGLGRDDPPLSALVLELVLAGATSPDVVAEVHVDHEMVTITRGPVPLEVETFELADHYDPRFATLHIDGSFDEAR